MRTPSFKRIAEAERVLQADIRWTIDKGPGWSPSHGAVWSEGKFQPHNHCGVCAIGSHVLRHCRGRAATKLIEKWSGEDSFFTRDVTVAAHSLRLPLEFVDAIYHAVMETQPGAPQRDGLDVARQLGWRLRDYGDTQLRLQKLIQAPQLKSRDYRQTFAV